MFNDERDEMINILQRNLRTIRILLGLSSNDLGNLIHISKQTISNLELNRCKMSGPIYISLVVVINFIIEDKPELSHVIPSIIKMDGAIQKKSYNFGKFKAI